MIVSRRIGGLEIKRVNTSLAAKVSRRIGGLENSVHSFAIEHHVSRRIGGLEILKPPINPFKEVSRRIGGLEKQDLHTLHAAQVSRRTGSMEKQANNLPADACVSRLNRRFLETHSAKIDNASPFCRHSLATAAFLMAVYVYKAALFSAWAPYCFLLQCKQDGWRRGSADFAH